MKQLFLNYRHNNEIRKNTYQIQFRNGETVSSEGFLESENIIQRANFIFLFPLRAVKENIFYFLLLILQAFSSLPLYFVAIPLVLQQWIIDLHNCLKIRNMDKMLKEQEAKIIKQWDECIVNKEIISKIKERQDQKDQSESNLRLKSKSQFERNSQNNKKIEYGQSQKKGISRTIISNDSIPFQQIQYKQQQSNKNIKASENIKKQNQMSPLIYKDLALKLQQIQIMETDPLIIQFKKLVPSIFPKDLVQTTAKIPLNEKLKKMEKDKMNLIKSQNVQDIKIGEVILLQRNEIAPCDIIVLHCNDENFCVQQQLCDYSQSTVRKPVVQNRSESQTLVQFKKSLTGNIVFHEQNSQIKGFFQLKKDPQSKMLDFENFIFCQEKLLATPWILGVVVKVGNGCFCYQKLQGKLRFDNNQYFGFYFVICVIMIIQIIAFNQNKYLFELRQITQIVLDNCIYIILMVPHFFKMYYNICGLFQLTIIGTIDQKQIMSCHIDRYLEKQFLTVSVEAFIEQSFKLKRIIYNNQYCDFEEQQFLQFLTTAENGLNKQDQGKNTNYVDLEQMNNQFNSQVVNYDMQSSSSEILFSQRECIVNKVPKSVDGRFIHFYQQDYKDEQNLNQAQLIFQEQIQNDKNLFENQDIGDHLTAQRQSNQQKNSKIYQSPKDQMKQDKYLIDENTLYQSMIQNNQKNELNPLLLQFAINHLAFSKLLITEKQEQKVKNKFLSLLDQKQVNMAKMMGYEFICVNNVQQQQHYIIQINKELYQFKLVNTKLHIQNQRLYMLFEMDDQSQEIDQQYILFLREANVRKNESIEDKVLKNQSDSLHYIYYYYCFLSQEEANLYLSSAECNTSENQLYTLMEQLFKLNIIFGLSYELKQDCQEFMKNVRKSDYQLFIYTQNQEISATSILYQTELLQQNDLIFYFNQQNEEDLRAYFKQCLEEFSNQFSNASINSSRYIKISNYSAQKSTELDRIAEKSKTKKVVVILNNTTCQQIMENAYFKNHLKLLLNFTKALFLYQATQDQLNIVQELWCTSEKTINLLYENQSLLRCVGGCQIQILQLQQFSQFRNQKFGRVDKNNFFRKLKQSLRQRLIYEKCYFNELQINSNTEVIIQGFKELDRLLFFQSPLLKILFRSLQQQTVYKTITFISYFTFTSILYTWNTLDQQNYLIEIVFYFYIYQFFLFGIQHYQFLDDSKKLKYTQDQSLLLQMYSKHKSETEIQILIIIKNILQGILISCIFLYDIYQEEFYLYIFMSISISDWLYIIINFELKLKIIASSIFSLLFYIYTLLDAQEDEEWKTQINTQEVFSIILGVSFMLITNILAEYLQNYNVNDLPKREEEFLSYLSYIHLMSAPAKKKKTVTILQNKVNDLFDNIEQVDLSIQKLLLNEQNYQSRFGQWTQQIFHKAQTILQWKQKQTIQCLQLLFYHCTFLLIMYLYQDYNNYFLVDYLIIFGLQVIVFILFTFIQLPTNRQQYLEYAKFIIATAATVSILFASNNSEDIGSTLVMQYFITYQLSIKFHPIYDYRLYLGSTLTTIIGYIVWYIIQNESNVSFMIQILQFIVLFSGSQYFVKSYFIQLEEDQAQNKLNFIEQNNKINDILGILLPKFIRDRLNETDQYNIHQNQGLVAIVFCDICNFDQMVIEEKDKIIPFLDDIFRTFDKFCQVYGVQKIETVGKTYLASAGLKACEQELTYLSQVDPVQRALNLAEQMMNYIRSKQWGTQGQQLVGKIGIHYGGAISGVIGFHKPQFSLIGDTVNTTSRVCSTGLEDTITLSEQAFDQLKNENIEFEIRNVEMKGLGIRPTYIFKCKVQNKDNTYSIQNEQDLQSRDARSNYVVRKNPEILKKNLKKRKTILTYIDTMNQRRDSIQDKGPQNVFGIKPTDPALYQSYDEKSEQSIQLLSKQVSDDKQGKQNSLEKPSTFKRLVTMLQNRFQLENYEPEIDEMIDYEQLLNVILLKNEYTLEHNLIKDISFLQLLEISYYKKQMNQFISYDQYMEFVKLQSKNQTIYNLRLYTLYYMIKQFCQIQFYNDYNIVIIVLQWFCCILNLIQFLINRKPYFEKWKILIKILLLIQVILAGIAIVLDVIDELKNVHVYEIVFIQCIFCSVQILSFWVKVLFCFFNFFYLIIIICIDGTQLISIFFIFVSSMYNLTLILFIEQQQISCFNQKNIFKTQQQKESQLLQYLLPKHILNKFLDDKINNIGICDKLDKLTILFADIAGFTEYSSKVKPEEVLVMLKNLFVEFDRKCCELNVYKLYTIGDCYVAIGMIDYNNRNPHQEAKNIVDLAFEMIKIITQVRKQINFDGLNMRIGIHTGSVFGGIMGTDIVRYDIYGPDVLIANKMESNGVKGFVHVSQETKAYLEQDYDDLFTFEMHTTIDLKTIKRQIQGFLIHKLEQDHFPEEEDQFLSS